MNWSKVSLWFGVLVVNLLLWVVVIWLVGAGCEQANGIISDPNMGLPMEHVFEQGVGLTQALGALWPALIPIGTAAGGVLAAYKRLKPKIIESQKQGNAYYAAGETLATVLDDIKINHPDIWKNIGPKIANVAKSASEIENTIRGFRHLPPKTGALS